ncbi:MAG: chemotaxis protein CheB [Nitrospirae bacterium]|nr:chemotaxis protein CheB [Nitrospirota bacterium]
MYKIKRTSGINLQKTAFPSFKNAGLQQRTNSITQNKIVIIGASTGGPKAIETILSGLQREIPASVIIVQHLGKKLMPSFAERLSWMSSFDVSLAGDNDVIEPGRIMVAPGGFNTIIVQDEDKTRIAIAGRSKHFDDFPSIDTTMKSAANAYGKEVIGVLLTGIGDDGVKGLKAIKEAGGSTIVEEQSTCMVYGMPKAAIEAGVADEIISLPFIAEAIMKKLI